MTASEKKAAPKQAVPKVAATKPAKRDAALCHFGGPRMSYGAKTTAHCNAPHIVGHPMCQKHEDAWKVVARKRAADRKAAAPAKRTLTAVKSTPATMESEMAAVRKMRSAARKSAAQVAPLAAPAPDAMTICNGCDIAPALPDSAAGYCADCEATAKATTVAALVVNEE